QRTVIHDGSVPAMCGLTGGAAARRLLAAIGLENVRVVRSNSVDCYHPKTKEVRLRDSTFDSSSLGALAIAAHELAHRKQFATVFGPAGLPTRVRPLFSLFPGMFVLLAVLGCAGVPLSWMPAGIIVLGLSLMLLQIPAVLPLEYDASRRATALV